MTHHFSLTLDRELTEQESGTLKEESSADLSFASATLPTDANVSVTRVTFEDAVTPTLAEAIEAGFVAVKTIPHLSIPCLSVPAQPAKASPAAVTAGAETAEDETEANS